MWTLVIVKCCFVVSSETFRKLLDDMDGRRVIVVVEFFYSFLNLIKKSEGALIWIDKYYAKPSLEWNELLALILLRSGNFDKTR